MKELKSAQENIELNSEQLQEIVDGILKPYTEDLDNYVEFIRGVLSDPTPPSPLELDDFCINLATYLYYAGAMQERLGLKDDISRAIYKEVYNSHRQTQSSGTVADRNALAELASQNEELISICYKRAFNTAKAKVTAGQELLSSVKKVISRRMQESELANFGGKS